MLCTLACDVTDGSSRRLMHVEVSTKNHTAQPCQMLLERPLLHALAHHPVQGRQLRRQQPPAVPIHCLCVLKTHRPLVASTHTIAIATCTLWVAMLCATVITPLGPTLSTSKRAFNAPLCSSHTRSCHTPDLLCGHHADHTAICRHCCHLLGSRRQLLLSSLLPLAVMWLLVVSSVACCGGSAAWQALSQTLCCCRVSGASSAVPVQPRHHHSCVPSLLISRCVAPPPPVVWQRCTNDVC